MLSTVKLLSVGAGSTSSDHANACMDIALPEAGAVTTNVGETDWPAGTVPMEHSLPAPRDDGAAPQDVPVIVSKDSAVFDWS